MPDKRDFARELDDEVVNAEAMRRDKPMYVIKVDHERGSKDVRGDLSGWEMQIEVGKLLAELIRGDVGVTGFRVKVQTKTR